MARFFRIGSLLLLAGCSAPDGMLDHEDLFPDEGTRYQIVVQSVVLSSTKPGGSSWDAGDGRPDPCVLVGDEWGWTDMTPIAFDEYEPTWNFVTYYDYGADDLQSIALTINDEDPPGEDDGGGDTEPAPEPTPTPGPTPDPQPTPTPPPDNGLACDKIEGSEIGEEGTAIQVGTTVVTFHDWVLKVGETDEYHGFSWDQTGTVDVRVKAGTETFIASGGSWLHPDAGANAPAISHVEVCQDTDDQLHNAIYSLVPDDEEGDTFVFEPGPGKGVERLVISVQKSEWSY